MKKFVLVQTVAIALLVATGSASAEENTPPVSEMPLDQGIVIDVSNGEVDATNSGTDAIANEGQEQTTEDATANDGTNLPLDQGNIDAADIETGVETTPEVTEPEQDTVVLTEKEPVVEKLPQTGIESNGILFAGVVGILGLLGLMFTKLRRKEENAL